MLHIFFYKKKKPVTHQKGLVIEQAHLRLLLEVNVSSDYPCE